MLTLLRLESGEEGAGVPYEKVFWPVGLEGAIWWGPG